MDFSFSGIKTAVINLNHKDPNINKANLCASFEKTVTEILIENTKKSINYIKNTVWVDNPDRQQNYPIKLALAGGVSANSYIRNEFAKIRKRAKYKNILSRIKIMYRQCSNDSFCRILQLFSR